MPHPWQHTAWETGFSPPLPCDPAQPNDVQRGELIPQKHYLSELSRALTWCQTWSYCDTLSLESWPNSFAADRICAPWGEKEGEIDCFISKSQMKWQLGKHTNMTLMMSSLQRYHGPAAGQWSSPGCSWRSSTAPWAHASTRSFHTQWQTVSACKTHNHIRASIQISNKQNKTLQGTILNY